MTTLEATKPALLTRSQSARDVHAPSDVEVLSKRSIIAGRVVSGLAVLFLTFDVMIKLLRLPVALGTMQELGYPESLVVPIGVIGLVCLIAYVVPRTALIGAVLWTGYLGGAIATHVRVENPLFSHVLFPIYIALFIWGGLWLRDPRVRALLRGQ